MRRIVWALFCACCSVAAASAFAAEVPGSHPLVNPFPESEISDYARFEEANHLFALGALQRVRGEVIPDESVRLRGLVTQIVYSIPEGYEGAEVDEYFRMQFESQGAETVFQCRGRSCGSSNYWANDIFKRRILYGPERNQFYLAMRTTDQSENATYIAVYVITRANKQLKVYVELVEPGLLNEAEMQVRISAELLKNLLTETGRVALPEVSAAAGEAGLDTEFDTEILQSVVELLAAQPSLRLYVVAHSGGQVSSLAEQMASSVSRAQELVAALVAAGAADSRLIAAGVGPLAPSCGKPSCGERFELVLIAE